MLAEYSVVVPSLAASISAFIAVVVGQFYKDHPIAKVVLVVATGLFAVITSGTIIWNQHQIIVQKDLDNEQREAEAKHKTEVRETLGSYIGTINALIAITADNSKPIPSDESNKVGFQLQAYLKDNLGQSYVTRLLDTSIAGPIGIHSGNTSRDGLWYVLYAARLRLEEFSRQLAD